MPDKYIHRRSSLFNGFPLFIYAKKFILLQIILLIIFFSSCTPFAPGPQQLILSKTDIENTIKNIKEQEAIVSNFYFTGTVTVNGWVWDTSADILIAAIRNPFMFKIEISHSWGKPLFYFLVKEDRLEIRDFTEKKHYIGKFTAANLTRFLPDMDCSPEMIWSFLRGYPHFSSYASVYEDAPGVLSIEDQGKRGIGIVTLDHEKGIKEAVSFPPRSLNIKFTDFRKTGDIYYAENTVVEDINDRRDMTVERKRIVFNRNIPDELFTLENKPFFEVVYLEE